MAHVSDDKKINTPTSLCRQQVKIALALGQLEVGDIVE